MQRLLKHLIWLGTATYRVLFRLRSSDSMEMKGGVELNCDTVTSQQGGEELTDLLLFNSLEWIS